MISVHRPDLRNRLLSLATDADFEILRSRLEFVSLKRGHRLVEPNEPSPWVYFLEHGLASQIAITADDRRAEVGVYGREGVGPTCHILGVTQAPHQHIIQIEGDGFRIAAPAFAEALELSPSLRAMLLRYIQVVTVQTGYTALSNGSGVIGERLARWLLMCHDRLDGNDLAITHEFLGVMLGVRRSGVTDAIHILEGVKIIRATRGNIEILDRARLEETAGDSYGVPEAEYQRLIGPMR